MTGDDVFADEDFDRIAVLLAQQVEALISDKSEDGRKRRRRLTMLGVDCLGYGKPLIEVFATRPVSVSSKAASGQRSSTGASPRGSRSTS